MRRHFWQRGAERVRVNARLLHLSVGDGVSAAFALLSIAGQLTAALLLDLLAPTPGASVGWNLVAGLVLAFVAVSVAARGRRR